MEVRFRVDDDFINDLKKDTGMKTSVELADEALALFQWAVQEAKNGRVLVSQDSNGANEKQVVMTSLQKAARKVSPAE